MEQKKRNIRKWAVCFLMTGCCCLVEEVALASAPPIPRQQLEQEISALENELQETHNEEIKIAKKLKKIEAQEAQYNQGNGSKNAKIKQVPKATPSSRISNESLANNAPSTSSSTMKAAPEQSTDHPVHVAIKNPPPIPIDPTATLHAYGYGSELYYSSTPYVTVSTSPYLQGRISYDGGNVLNQAVTMNEDLLLLQERDAVWRMLRSDNLLLSKPIVELSGGVEGMLLQSHGFNDEESGSINLSYAELDVHAIASKWASAFLAFDFDSSPSEETGTRVPNSRLYLSRGFVNVGNLEQTPFYFTLGQYYQPFGRYSSDLVTAPLTLSLFRTNERALEFAYYKAGFNASAYTFTGNQTTNGDTFAKQGGFNVSYKNVFTGSTSLNVGGGVISNVADSQGMQNTGEETSEGDFGGFDSPTGSNALEHRVPGADVHFEFLSGDWRLVSEYESAIDEFAEEDATFNNDGALPQALHAELERDFKVDRYPFGVVLGYGRTWDALAFNLPEQSYWAALNFSIWRATAESLEFRHDVDYSTSDIATGSAGMDPTDIPIRGTGTDRNLILFQVGVYF